MIRLAAAVVLVASLSTPAFAQDDRGVVVAATASAVNAFSTSAFGFSASAGYQFSRLAAIEIEITDVPRLDAPSDVLTALTSSASLLQFANAGSSSFQTTPGRAVIFTTNFRAQLPTASRLTPVFVAGGGAANVRREGDLSIQFPQFPPGVPITALRPITQHVKISATDFALTIGGGLDVRLTDHVSVGADVRYVRLIGVLDDNLGRFGGGVRYRF